ncbi:MAG: aminoglycoside phosphotransferase family protein [Candidatus Nanopelagicales bacterium]
MLAAFGLPGAVTAYDEVGGGWSNRVLRLRTPGGDYAVKELRNAWGEPRWLDWLAEGWRVELAAIAAGIPAPGPVAAPDGGCVALVPRADGAGEVPVRVHRWVESRTVPREPVGTDLAHWLGGTLAALHGLALQPLDPGLYAGRVGLTTAEVWPDLVARSRVAGAPWTEHLAVAEPVARRASALLGDGTPPTVLVHGDVDQKNLLVADAGPLLIDWDVVVPAVPAHDLAHAAVTMAAWREPAAAAAVLLGYADGGGTAYDPQPSDLGPALASRLGWVRFTVDRALDARAAGQADLGDDAGLPALLDDLERRVGLAERWPDWLRT